MSRERSWNYTGVKKDDLRNALKQQKSDAGFYTYAMNQCPKAYYVEQTLFLPKYKFTYYIFNKTRLRDSEYRYLTANYIAMASGNKTHSHIGLNKIKCVKITMWVSLFLKVLQQVLVNFFLY